MDEHTLFEFSAAVEGWRLANSGEAAVSALSDEDHDALIAKYG